MDQEYIITHIKRVIDNNPWLTELYIDSRRLSDDIIATIIQILSRCHQLETLDLAGKDIQRQGALNLAALLKDPNCTLKSLDLSGSYDMIDYMDTIVEGLKENKSIKKLVLHCVNSRGKDNSNKLQVLWKVWDNAESRLEDIGLAANGIGDDTVIALFNSLVGKRKLKRLILELNTIPSTLSDYTWSSTLSDYISDSRLDPSDYRNHLTVAGWNAISNHLKSPDCILEELQLGTITDNDTDINAMESIAGALAHNQTLNGLYFKDHANADSTAKVYNTLACALCNKSSIMDTYKSNHSLKEIWQRHLSRSWYSLCSADLGFYLEINKNNNKADAARKKIVKTHFSGDLVVEPFLGMKTEVLPHVLAWMGKGGIHATEEGVYDGVPLLFKLVRDMPRVFCFVGNSTNVTCYSEASTNVACYSGSSKKGEPRKRLPPPPPPGPPPLRRRKVHKPRPPPPPLPPGYSITQAGWW